MTYLKFLSKYGIINMLDIALVCHWLLIRRLIKWQIREKIAKAEY